MDQLGTDFPWRLVLENTIVGISYMQNRRFLWANARMAEIFGYNAGELDGEPVRKLYVTQEDYDDVGRLMAGYSRDGFYTHERAMACKNGSLIWCRISGRLLRRNDMVGPSVWVVQDLTDKRNAENELRRVNQQLENTIEKRTSNLRRTNEALKAEIERRKTLQAASAATGEKFRTLFRHLPLGVLVVDAEGAIVEVNRTLQSYFGVQSRTRLKELMDDSSRVALPDGQTCSLSSLLRDHATARLAVERFEFAWIRAPGRLRHIAAIGAPLVTSRRGVVFTFADVTENRRQREREHEQHAALAHASRLSLMGQMASALAHELGQPLNACQSYLSGIRHRLGAEQLDLGELAHVLEKTSAHLDQAAQIIRNVRGFVSRHKPLFQSVPLGELIDRTLLLLQQPIRSGGVQVDVIVSSATTKVPNARCNAIEIQQVLTNLLINAIEAIREADTRDPCITVRVGTDSRRMLYVEVSDNGPGVPEDLIPRLCEPYVTTKPSGLGMGLMISRTIVESHGGHLRYLPQRGTGATFRFTLPAWHDL
ncbi:PAS domain S-box protein [Bradyrhizobium sp. CB1015]|uniref:PAS domain-containing sensor histidine kinase n=1 Tax=Bradyrhizobium sp. CB1015 TaxID=2976822 RepID=UPI0021AA233B|nr:PAS domain S-box protein [Bradyrhizobium sp. CB1015]UWU89065.1 PAS domain S-box protein [Bradyrhizobium sp. CB1015]